VVEEIVGRDDIGRGKDVAKGGRERGEIHYVNIDRA
jgi:hypothetical protein